MKDSIVVTNIDKLKRGALIVLIVFSVLECFFHPESENLYGCLVLITGWVLLQRFVLKQVFIDSYLLPFLALLGLGFSFFFLPLIITFIEGKPLTFRFENPYLTFNNQLINLVMLICAFRASYHIYHESNSLQRIWAKIGYFTPPTDAQLWALGLIGVLSRVFLLLLMGTEGARAENQGIIGHLAGVTSSFVAFPVMLLFKDYYGGDSSHRASKTAVIWFMVLVAAIGLATGKRQIMFLPFMTIGVCYLLPAFTENRDILGKRGALICLIGAYLVTGPVADMAVAMAVGRDNSHQTSSSNTLSNIWDIYTDKETLHTMYQIYIANQDNEGDNSAAWSEYYVDNIIFDRFCNLRVCDATLSYVEKLGYSNPKMQEYLSNQVLFVLPTPILNLMGIHINKFDLQYTPGDLISTEGLGLDHQYFGYRVAGDTGIGLYLWGYMYYFFAFFIYAALFYFLASTTMISNSRWLFPVPVITSIFGTIWSFNNATGIVGVITTLLRTGWQAIVVYCIIFFIIRKIIK